MQFELVAAELGRALGDAAIRVDHIGSTAVPGLAAKDVLDVQVTVGALADVPADALAGLGYEELVGAWDHVPAWSTDDPARWTKRLWSRRDVLPRVNLHVRRRGSPNERFALLCRDYLRASPRARAAYQAAKEALAAVIDDIPTYAEVKDPVVDVVMAAAEEWAATSGWTAPSGPSGGGGHNRPV